MPERDVDAAAPPVTGEMLAAISREIVRLKAQHYGKGPESAKSYVNDDFIFCVMKGGLTPVEQTLVGAGDEDLVRQVRLRFQEQMTAVFRDAVERIVHRRVINHHSQVLVRPDYTIEMFVLGEPDDVGLPT
jgi:uncharacterized protein YbcI